MFPTRLSKSQGCPFSLALLNTGLDWTLEELLGEKKIQTGEEIVKVCLLTNDMVVYIENRRNL